MTKKPHPDVAARYGDMRSDLQVDFRMSKKGLGAFSDFCRHDGARLIDRDGQIIPVAIDRPTIEALAMAVSDDPFDHVYATAPDVLVREMYRSELRFFQRQMDLRFRLEDMGRDLG